MKKPVKKITSVSALIEALEGLPKPKDSVYYFRGHTNHRYELKPSIYRETEWKSNEDRLFREMVLRCPDEFRALPTTFEKLVKMQHYSFPTRLLDLTGNPLVALYFACLPHRKAGRSPNGELKVFSVPKDEIKYFDSDTVSIIANLARLGANFSLAGMDTSDKVKFNKEPEIGKLLHQIRQEKSGFRDEIEPGDLESVVLVKAKLDNPRIIRQDGTFFLFGIKVQKMECAEIPGKYDVLRERLIIPAGYKADLLKELDELATCEASLFPEIDKVARYLQGDWLHA